MKYIIYIVTAILLVITVLFTGCQPSNSGTGTMSKSTEKEKVIVITYSATTATQIGTGMLPDTPKSGHIFLILNMSIENHGYDSFSTSYLFFSVTTNNIEYSPVLLFGLDNKLPSVNVLDNGSITGKLAFEVPIGTNTFSVQYQAFQTYNIHWEQI